MNADINLSQMAFAYILGGLVSLFFLMHGPFKVQFLFALCFRIFASNKFLWYFMIYDTLSMSIYLSCIIQSEEPALLPPTHASYLTDHVHIPYNVSTLVLFAWVSFAEN